MLVPVIASRFSPGNGIQAIWKQEGLGLQVKNGPHLERVCVWNRRCKWVAGPIVRARKKLE